MNIIRIRCTITDFIRVRNHIKARKFLISNVTLGHLIPAEFPIIDKFKQPEFLLTRDGEFILAYDAIVNDGVCHVYRASDFSFFGAYNGSRDSKKSRRWVKIYGHTMIDAVQTKDEPSKCSIYAYDFKSKKRKVTFIHGSGEFLPPDMDVFDKSDVLIILKKSAALKPLDATNGWMSWQDINTDIEDSEIQGILRNRLVLRVNCQAQLTVDDKGRIEGEDDDEEGKSTQQSDFVVDDETLACISKDYRNVIIFDYAGNKFID